MKKIKYSEGYKYQLEEDFEIDTPFRLGLPVQAEYISMTIDGKLHIREGYAWDGPSGPTIDTPSSMRGALVHDALYQLLREGFLSPEAREKADRMLYDLCREDGMDYVRAKVWYYGVRWFAADAADFKNERKVLTAP